MSIVVVLVVVVVVLLGLLVYQEYRLEQMNKKYWTRRTW